MNRNLLPFQRRIILLLGAHRRGLTTTAVVALGFGALMVAAGPEGPVIRRLSGAVASCMAVAAPIIMAGRVRHVGEAQWALWVQRPVSVVRVELLHFLEAWAASMGIVVLVAMTSLVGSGGGGSTSVTNLLAGLAGLVLLPLALGAVTFGFSAWLGRAGRIAAFVVFGASVMHEFLLAASVLSTAGDGGSVWSAMANAVLFPVPAMVRIADFGAGAATATALWISVGWLVSYACAWVLIGLAGIRWTVATGGAAADRGSGE